ncbi:MAG: hypothetical protein ACJ75A_18815 [Actinomycetes bacterium]
MASREITGLDGSLPTAERTSRTEAAFGAIITARATKFLAVFRVVLGFEFLWAFLDKTFGLGYATPAAKAWINGGSPTKGFLSRVAVGPLEGTFHTIAGAAWADWLFMAGLLGLGTALLLGVAMRLAAASGALLLVLMWTVVLPPANNPFMDDHLVYAMLLVILAAAGAGTTLGLATTWGRIPLVRRHGWLR